LIEEASFVSCENEKLLHS